MHTVVSSSNVYEFVEVGLAFDRQVGVEHGVQ